MSVRKAHHQADLVSAAWTHHRQRRTDGGGARPVVRTIGQNGWVGNDSLLTKEMAAAEMNKLTAGMGIPGL